MKTIAPAPWLDFFRLLATAAANADLYSPQHPQVASLGQRAHSLVTALFHGEADIDILLLDQNIILRNTPLPATLHTSRFVEALKNLGIEHVRLNRAITEPEIMSLILLLSKRQQEDRQPNNSAHLRFGCIDGLKAGRDRAATDQEHLPCDNDLLRNERDRLEEICSAAGKKRSLSVIGLKEIVARFLHALNQQLNPLLAIFPLHRQDRYSFTHSTNVCLLTLAHARRLGLDGSALQDIGIAALLHDVGKLFLPVDIINKPGSPTEEEWQMIRLHPVRGAEYLLTTSGISQLSVVTAYEHHMKFDLSGYPQTGKDWQQHLCSHMTTISDIFDALRTKRAYRDAMDAGKICEMLTGMAGGELHPQLTASFLKMIDEASSSAAAPQTP